MPPPPGSSAAHSRTRVTDSPSPIDTNDNPPSSSRLSRDSEGYPSWLPKRPPLPAPASTFQSSVLALAGAVPPDPSPSPVEPTFTTGCKPTPRAPTNESCRLTIRTDHREGAFTARTTDQTRVGVHVPPKVWTRAAGVPVAFNASNNDDGFLPLPQPRFNAKHLNLQILRNPSRWMKAYFFLWPLLVFYHLPLQSFFDFNAVYILLQ